MFNLNERFITFQITRILLKELIDFLTEKMCLVYNIFPPPQGRIPRAAAKKYVTSGNNKKIGHCGIIAKMSHSKRS